MSPPLYLSMVSILTFALLLHLLSTCVAETTQDCSLQWLKIDTGKDYIEFHYELDSEKEKQQEPKHLINFKKLKDRGAKNVTKVEELRIGKGYATLYSNTRANEGHKDDTEYCVHITRKRGVPWHIREHLPDILTKTINQFSETDSNFASIASKRRIRLAPNLPYGSAKVMMNRFNSFEEKMGKGAKIWTFVQQRDVNSKKFSIVSTLMDSKNTFRVSIEAHDGIKVTGCSVSGGVLTDLLKARLESGKMGTDNISFYYCVFDQASIKTLQDAMSYMSDTSDTGEILLSVKHTVKEVKQKKYWTISNEKEYGRKTAKKIYVGDFNVGQCLEWIELK
eukprot:GHVS01034594.1.p1 GENE.GHVS01034594.1~~GHVS01034594.1.p1  ORF type:complete len:336 (+),score=20.35 GHVS01034594.1:134-1141(+)